MHSSNVRFIISNEITMCNGSYFKAGHIFLTFFSHFSHKTNTVFLYSLINERTPVCFSIIKEDTMKNKENSISFREKFRSLRKKKSFRIISVIVLAVIAGSVAFFVIRTRKQQSSQTTTIQQATAQTGTISSTVDGTGTLGVGTTTDVNAPLGIKISQVLVSAGDTVTAGQTLATLDEASVAQSLLSVDESISSVQSQIDSLTVDTSDTTSTSYLENIVLQSELNDLNTEKATLTDLASSLVITASCDGTVSSVNVSNDTTISKTSSGTSTSGTSSVSGTSSSTGKTSSSSGNILETSSVTEKSASVTLLSGTGSTLNKITDLTNLAVKAPSAGETPESTLNIPNSSAAGYTGTITWDCLGRFQSGSVYTATIILTAESGYTFPDASSILVSLSGASISADTPRVIGTAGAEGNSLYIKAIFQTPSDTSSSSTSAGNAASGTGSANTENETSGNTAVSSSDSGTTSSSAAGSTASSSSADTASSAASSASTSTSDYSNYQTAAFSIASGNDMSLSVTVDELDINSVKKGQTAAVTIDALDSQTYSGTISKISTSSSSSGSSTSSSSGSAKYTATITLSKSDGMLAGMSASASITVDESADAVLIPVNALQEEGNTTFVYTSEDSDGTLGGKTVIETGVSNGSQVAVTSGLSAGTTVYYLKTTTTSTDSKSQMPGGTDQNSSMGGSMPSGGTAPSGGSMPSGGSAPSGGGQMGGSNGSN